jgi:hypothetical protein
VDERRRNNDVESYFSLPYSATGLPDPYLYLLLLPVPASPQLTGLFVSPHFELLLLLLLPFA